MKEAIVKKGQHAKRVGEKTAAALMKKGSNAVDNAILIKDQMDKKRIRPVFKENLTIPGFKLPRMIHVVDDDKYKRHKVMEDAIGHIDKEKGLEFITVYTENISFLDLDFYPGIYNENLFFINPCFQNQYISLDDYFNYLADAKISEMDRIAQELGAVFFEVKLMEKRERFVNTEKKINSKKNKSSIQTKIENKEKDLKETRVLLTAEYGGHDPSRPELKYLKSEESINTLINKRLNDSEFKEQHYIINYNNVSGITLSNASKIDCILKTLKLNTNISIKSKVEYETMKFFEYHIKF